LVRLFLVVLLVVYCAKQVATALLIPPFTGHDELAHYEYVRVLSDQHRVPTLTTDRLPPSLYRYRAYVLDWERWGPFRGPLYTALHPPLYYAYMVPFYRMVRNWSVEEQQYLLRLGSIPFGAVTVLLAYAVARVLFPDDAFLAIGTSALVAFQPQVSYEASLVNNDAAATALCSVVIWLMLWGIRKAYSPRVAVATGAALGAALLAKSTALTAAPLVFASLWLAPGAGGWRQRAWKTALALGTAAVIVAPWYAFMFHTYGDFSGLRQTAVLQPNRIHDVSFLQLLFSGTFAVNRWEETWGLFGWRLIPVSGWVLAILAGFAIASVIGVISFFFVARVANHATERSRAPQEMLARWQAVGLLILVGTCVISYLAVVQFGTRFTLAQARYYFPAVNAWALLTILGLRSWLPGHGYRVAQGALVLGLVALNIFIYTVHVVPFWYFY
jgi:4-amino-4-deoxy-L-arabinose transferase-like glycosyltransferase